MSQTKALIYRQKGMGNLLLSLISVLLFCVSAHFFAQAVTEPMDFVRAQDFSRKALRIERWYKISSWAILTMVLFYSMLVAFLHTFRDI